ncbi:hypothetical protein [Amycolatopsis saalfeldensis]|uniref:Uncharacterized protein n=1 Tax=Amycolatopsis saalfeldensis TaxID=394193 RepID=A0A1H8YI20_9PSEU|nr:hypothetical protein [Amycolatopsis saalfeldensis]SEP51777.1 hypothetical protein SAMN04489732_11795 [Amycolatopsis saalfeldensis]
MNDDYVRQVLAWLRSALPLRPETLDSAWSGRARLPAIPRQGEDPGGAAACLPAIPPPGAGRGDAGVRLPAIPPPRVEVGAGVGVLIPAPRLSSES